eukprot:g72607.t1
MVNFFQRYTVPSLLHAFFGQTTTIADVLCCLVSLVMFPVLLARLFPYEFDMLGGRWNWRTVLFCLVTGDLGGGAVANVTLGTNRFWARQRRILRMGFVLFHGLHIALLLTALPGGWHGSVLQYMGITYAVTVGCALLVLYAGRAQRQVAFLSMTLAIPCLLYLDCGYAILRPITLLYLLKLVCAFAVVHYPLSSATSLSQPLLK